jgi:hypothetical protein
LGARRAAAAAAAAGESGAGKSVLLESLNQLLGASSPPDCVRPPADMAVVEGSFRLGGSAAAAARQLLAGLGLPHKALPAVGPGAKLLIRREVCSAAGAAAVPLAVVVVAPEALAALPGAGCYAPPALPAILPAPQPA